MWMITMARGDWSMADELGWREAARRWFLARGVEANLAEDLTQEALLRLLRGQQRGQPLTRAYLYRVCQSVLYDHLRQCAREPNCQLLETCRCVAVVEMGFQQAEDRVFLEQALGQLRPLERAIVEMHHLEEQTFETIAATLGIPVERAKKISQRAIKKMQQWARSCGGGGVKMGGLLGFGVPQREFCAFNWSGGQR
jgi:RNA polymerase sigma factor (sigma-70 family)